MSKYDWKQADPIIKENWRTLSDAKISEMTGIDEQSITKRRRKFGLIKEQQSYKRGPHGPYRPRAVTERDPRSIESVPMFNYLEALLPVKERLKSEHPDYDEWIKTEEGQTTFISVMTESKLPVFFCVRRK